MRFAFDSWKAHEIPLARQLIGWIEPTDVVVADRGFCGWGFIALLQRKGVDVVMRAHQARKLAGKSMIWAKPQHRCPVMESQIRGESLLEERQGSMPVRFVAEAMSDQPDELAGQLEGVAGHLM